MPRYKTAEEKIASSPLMKMCSARRVMGGYESEGTRIRLYKLLSRMGFDAELQKAILGQQAKGVNRTPSQDNLRQLNTVTAHAILAVIDKLCVKVGIDPYGDEDERKRLI